MTVANDYQWNTMSNLSVLIISIHGQGGLMSRASRGLVPGVIRYVDV